MTQDRAEQDQHLSWVFESERRRLLAFIRRRIPDEIDAEDLLQDVFCELVEAYRLMKPVAHAGAWMMQVAKNRITDLFRRRQTKVVEDGGSRILEDLLPSPDAALEGDLASRGVDAYHSAFPNYYFCAICDFDNGSLTLLSQKIWASEVIRRVRPVLKSLDTIEVEMRLPS